MSLIVYLETAEEELLLAGDSRLSYENDPNRYEDNIFKVFEYDGRVGIAFHGDADICGVSIESIINDFIGELEGNLTVYDAACKLRECIQQKKNDQDTWFYVLGFSSGKKEIYRFNVKRIGSRIDNVSASRYVSGEGDDFAWDILEEEYKINKPYIEALDFLKETFKRKMQNDDTVGGDVDIILITKDEGLRWISRKS